ncbi:hypothetical protein ACTMTF_40280 [Nonomuraea sp. ZG12]|uniref:hypothetical protein n=1 Tax=Nonomuraea sp. ZG12 TaxID=3452207 RepID=UPI003F8C5AC3
MARNQGMMALLSHLLVVWRAHQMVRTDWSAEEQAYALQVVGVGFQETLTRWSVFSDLDEEARSATLSASLIEILGVRDVPEPDLRTAVAEAVHIIEVMCSRLRERMDELTGHDATAG